MMSGEIHELTEVLIRRVFLDNKAPALVSETIISDLSEAMKVYGDTLTREATKNIVSMAFDLEGYKDTGLEVWKLLYQINHIRVQISTLDPKDKYKLAASLEKILTSRGIKIENGETNAKS